MYIYHYLTKSTTFLVTISSDDTIGDLKKLVAAQTGTKWDKIVLKKWLD